ncbi:hypothetical protein M3Y98_00968800 [Aphelenchoides besseyi]|nr:hypothetical protein M3Y98_00968800 [Aphelenchoides besseyi]KAI6194760.1 hypothetical protein M3Y96_01158900 [Aphelenchoides besseyi]
MSLTSELMEGIKKQRELVNSLRQSVLDINKYVNNVYKVESNGLASGNVDDARESWRKFGEQLEETYESLESSTLQMAKSKDKWNSAEMNRLHTFLLDALADPNNAEIYNKALKLTNTRDTTDNYTKYTQEFLKAFGGSTNRHRKLPKVTPYAMSAHNEQIESCLKTLKDTATNKNRTLWRWLERNAYGGLLEVRAVYSSQSQQVDLVKMCIIVTNGVIDYVQFLATHEEWTYREENRKQCTKQIRLFSSSECLRKQHVGTQFDVEHIGTVASLYRHVHITAEFRAAVQKLQEISEELRTGNHREERAMATRIVQVAEPFYLSKSTKKKIRPSHAQFWVGHHQNS